MRIERVLSFYYFCKIVTGSVVNRQCRRLMGKTESKMESLEQDFAQIVRELKGTIYTVCYMF